MHNLKNDIVGGIIAGIIALPLALAFGIASGLGASAGLWGAIVLGFFAAAFGGTKMQISGPTGPMSVVSAAIVMHFAGDINTIMSIFVLAGIFQILFGVFRLGKFIKFIPYSVVSGFMTGVGFIIIILQINPMLGSKGVGDTLLAIKSLPETLANIDISTLFFALITIALIYLTPKKISKIIPPALIAILVLTPLCAVLNINIATIGDIPTGFAEFIIPNVDFTKIFVIIMYAITLAVLGSIDSLLTSLVADSITKTKHNSNQELIGQGVGNALVGFVGGIPGAGATMRTVANIKAGGMGRISGITHSVFLLLVVLIFAPIVSYIPLAVLAGILVKVGIDILDYRLLKRIFYIPKKDLVVMIIVFLLTVFVNLIFAVGVGTILAWIFYQTSIPKVNKNLETTILNDDENQKFIEIKGSMYFGNSTKIVDFLNLKNKVKNLTLDCTKATFIDISSIYALEDFINCIDKEKTKVDILISEKTLKGNGLNEFKYVLKDYIISK